MCTCENIIARGREFGPLFSSANQPCPTLVEESSHHIEASGRSYYRLSLTSLGYVVIVIGTMWKGAYLFRREEMTCFEGFEAILSLDIPLGLHPPHPLLELRALLFSWVL